MANKTNNNLDYFVHIESGSREFKGREEISIKDLGNAVSLDTELVDINATVVITPKDYAVLKVHNEHSKNDKDYSKYVVIDSAGTKYVTGSDSFFKAFKDIFDAMHEACPDEVYSIEVYKRPSKNYQGKYFLSCSILP